MAYWNLKINKAEVINTYKVKTCYGGQEDYMDVMLEGTIGLINNGVDFRNFKFLVSDHTWSFSSYDSLEERYQDDIEMLLREVSAEDFLEICQKSIEDSYVINKVKDCHGKYGK